jgi:plasmid stabilization system protein ParE
MGTFKVIFVPQAQTDLALAVRYIARQSGSEIAERVGLSLVDKALSLSTFPERGRILPELKNLKSTATIS